jgi:ubiquinone/menaquinone biosynthesis C-methylase UbiE
MSEASDAYDAWHAKHDVDDGVSTPWHRQAASMLKVGTDIRGKRVLEIGCGRGGFAGWLERQGADLLAADFSDEALRQARAHFAGSSIQWMVQDIQRLTLEDNSFDTVISCETVEHVPDPRRVIQELARVLRPGGILVLTCPNYLGPMGLYRAYMRLTGRRFTEEGQPINQLTLAPRTFYWLRLSGLSVEAYGAQGHYLPVPGRPPIRALPLDRISVLSPFALHSAFRARKPPIEARPG